MYLWWLAIGWWVLYIVITDLVKVGAPSGVGLIMGSYYLDQELRAGGFADLSGLPFSYVYTGGGCDAIYGETSKHRVYITNDASVPMPNETHYVGICLKDSDDLVGEYWGLDRAELVRYIRANRLTTMVRFVSHMIKIQPYKLGGE